MRNNFRIAISELHKEAKKHKGTIGGTLKYDVVKCCHKS